MGYPRTPHAVGPSNEEQSMARSLPHDFKWRGKKDGMRKVVVGKTMCEGCTNTFFPSLSYCRTKCTCTVIYILSMREMCRFLRASCRIYADDMH